MTAGADAVYPLVTVYLLNHNYGRFAEQAIRSVLDQTFQDFELIVIDDGSTDNSREVLEKYADHPKVTVVFQQNRGLTASANVALQMAKGRYIIRLDADDYFESHALAIMAGLLDRTPGVGLVFPDYYTVDEHGALLELVRRNDFDHVTLLDQPAHGACTMVRCECLEAMGGYDESYHCQDGWDLWVRFIRRWGVRNVNLPLFFYRQHGGSLTRNEETLLATRARIFAANAGEDKPLECVAIVPVRGPRLDRSSVALRSLGDRLVIDWTLDAALAAKRVTRVLVTTPDPAVRNHVRDRYGERIGVIDRDWHLALRNTSLDATLTDVFDHLPEDQRIFDAVALLFVESPFRTGRHIDMAVDSMQIFGTDRVIGARRRGETLYRHSGSGLEPLRASRLLRQEADEVFASAGDLMVWRRGVLYRDTDKDASIGHIEVDEAAALRVTSEWSLRVAQMHAAWLLQHDKETRLEAAS